MGDHYDQARNALPVHTVELDAFYMDMREVTVGQFKKFVQHIAMADGMIWLSIHQVTSIQCCM